MSEQESLLIDLDTEQDVDGKWETYKKKFNKVYEPEEDRIHRGIWEESQRQVAIHNRDYEEGKYTYTTGINQFSDMKPEDRGCRCRHNAKVIAHPPEPGVYE
ncbi:unnamed protein product [Knipowitschia caucasica]|uniref:Cathepsin propeptide inhibitor domain-containing protein n=1 Tax=Knipowitschia caucasica TaxID=637954 RepID=A0AAV2MF45_KNICA